jgi:hypothetical protein
MKKTIVSVVSCVIAFTGIAQQTLMREIKRINPPNVALAPLRFLASDELMGRGTLRTEINIAARYIGEQLRSMGVREVKGTDNYFQHFTIKVIAPATTGAITIDTKSYQLGKDLLQVSIEDVSISSPIVYAGYGSEEEFDKIDVKGKIVVTNFGANDSSGMAEIFNLRRKKQELVAARGGLALIERFKQAEAPWEEYQHYFMDERLLETPGGNLPVFIINDRQANLPSLIKSGTIASLTTTGNRLRNVPAKNVMGWIEGTDAKLKNEYLVLSAHYDHIGVAQKAVMEEGKLDSIYNGARDNAIGTTAIIAAARYFSQHPTKRSILIIAYTGEEMGLIGSNYFAGSSILPLKQLVYNMNIDNASYNDTSIVTVVGLGRTSADKDIQRAAKAYGLTAMPDPAPDQNLFDRSDNVSLAAKGIPAPTFSLGIKQFDENITNRYHQLSDEVENFDLKYAMKYIDSYILAAKYIADNTAQPLWIKGDKYEASWKKLFAK